MRLSYRDSQGHEIDRALAPAGDVDTYHEALQLLARRRHFEPGDAMFFTDDDAARLPPEPLIITANEIEALAARLARRACLIEGDDPEAGADARLAARLCRHAIGAGWVFRTVVLS